MRPLFKQRRDWSLIILILPLGIVSMLIAGQVAIRLMPGWRVSADISSKVNPGEYLDSNNLPDSVIPIRFEILTPMSWENTFLTPQAQGTDTNVVPLVVLNPSATPTSPTSSPPAPSPSSTPPTVVSTTSPTASPTVPSTVVVTATKDRDDPPETPVPTSSPTSSPTSTPTSNPTLPPVTSTIDPAMTSIVATPPGLNVGTPDGSNASGNDFPDGSYIVIDISLNPVVVNATPDGHYDLVFFEDENPDGSNQVAMDQVILGISNNPGGNPYYQVFYWGDGIPDTNTNVDTTALGLPSAEIDNQVISTTDLYENPSAPCPPPNLQTGILIDVDQAPSHPPPDTYEYLVIIAPHATDPNNAGDDGQVDSVQVTEVVSPVPP